MVIVDPGRKLSCLHGSRRSSSSICPHPPSPAFLTPLLFFGSFLTAASRPTSAEMKFLRIFGIFGLSRRGSHKKSELSLHQMAVRAFFGQKIRAEPPSNGCADDFFGQKSELSVDHQMASVQAKVPLSLHSTEILLCLSKHTGR